MTAQEQYDEAYKEWEEGWDFESMLDDYASDYLSDNRYSDMEVYPVSMIDEFFDNPEEAFRAGREIGNADYFRINGSGNFEPVDDMLEFYLDYIDEDEFKQWCMDRGKYDEEPELEDFEDEEEDEE